MNRTLQDLMQRRSCRRYLPTQLREEDLSAILEAGTYAPTGMNRQSPVIVAVQDAETVRTLSRLNAAVMGSDSDPFYGAPAVAVVLADPSVPTFLYDGALVMGNLMNAAQAVGVASCYIFRAKEMFESEEGKALLRRWGLREDLVGIGNCILGYAAEGGIREAAPRKENYVVRI